MDMSWGLHMKIHNKYALVFLIAVAGCASAPKPAPAPTPVAKPAPAPVVVTKPAPATASIPKPAPKLEPARPSIAATQSIDFDGSHFTVKYHAADKGQSITEYYLAAETPEAWTRLVDLQVYPTAAKHLSPADFATLVGQKVTSVNPSAHYNLYQNKAEGTVILDFITWDDAGIKANLLEVNLFKIYPDPKTGNLLSFHYAERVKTDPKAPTVDNGNKLKAVRQRVMNEIAAVPLYRE